MRIAILLLTACTTVSTDTTEDSGSQETDALDSADTQTPVPDTVAWDARLPSAASLRAPRELVARRAVVHLHSPWSHDACDNKGPVDGKRDPDCLADLQAGLCATRFDVAFLTDHPDYGDATTFDELLPADEGTAWTDDGGHMAKLLDCGDGHLVQLRAGFEDDLMPVGLARHVDADPVTRHDLLNRSDAEAIAAMKAAGAQVFVAHPEGRSIERLQQLRTDGLVGMEVFNLHAMFAPNIRADDLGLDSQWIGSVGPFVLGDANPDLLFLAVHQAQIPTLERFDALLADGPIAGVAGTDAHQNLPLGELSDGERGDSYRRMLRWFSTILLADDDSVAAADRALGQGRAYVAFEVLGSPVGFDLHVAHDGGITEMGDTGPAGDLVVRCPELHADAPRDGQPDAPIVRVLKDGVVWKESCGTFEADAGVYRVEVDLTGAHLAPFLEGAEALAERAYPWIISNAVRVE